MGTSTTPQPTLSDLVNAAEAALTQYTNDQNTVANDQAKITALQNQLANDQVTAANDGFAAYTAVQAVVAASTALLSTLPAPAAPPSSGSGGTPSPNPPPPPAP